MNWGIIGTIAGIAATLYGIRFVLDLFKSVFGKESRQRLIGTIGDKVSDANDSLVESLRKKAERRRQQKQEQKNEKPTIIIRR